MKKHKKTIVNSTQKESESLFIPVVKSSRLTINSRVCNVLKFSELFSILDNTKNYKNIISNYCYDNLTTLVSDYKNFLTNYKSFDSKELNAWEIQTIFQEISGHYYETAKRYLSKTTYKVNSPKTNISTIAKFIDFHSTLITINNNNNNNKTYEVNFNIEDNLIQLNTYLVKYISDLAQAKAINNDKEITSLEKKIKSYHKLIATYALINSFSLNKLFLYKRLIILITTKKIRLLSKVKLGIYKTGTYAKSFANGQR